VLTDTEAVIDFVSDDDCELVGVIDFVLDTDRVLLFVFDCVGDCEADILVDAELDELTLDDAERVCTKVRDEE